MNEIRLKLKQEELLKEAVEMVCTRMGFRRRIHWDIDVDIKDNDLDLVWKASSSNGNNIKSPYLLCYFHLFPNKIEDMSKVDILYFTSMVRNETNKLKSFSLNGFFDHYHIEATVEMCDTKIKPFYLSIRGNPYNKQIMIL